MARAGLQGTAAVGGLGKAEVCPSLRRVLGNLSPKKPRSHKRKH